MEGGRMTFTLRVLFLLLVIACGRGHDDKKAMTRTADPADDREEVRPESRIRYSAVTIEENCGFWTDCEFSVRVDYRERPLILNAHFVDSGWTGEEEVPAERVDTGACDFQVALSDAEAGILEGLADKLRLCQVRNTPTADGGFDGLFITDTSGKDTMVFKHRNGGQEEEGNVNYLCGGRRAYYSYLRQLIVPEAPEECPDAFTRLFR